MAGVIMVRDRGESMVYSVGPVERSMRMRYAWILMADKVGV